MDEDGSGTSTGTGNRNWKLEPGTDQRATSRGPGLPATRRKAGTRPRMSLSGTVPTYVALQLKKWASSKMGDGRGTGWTSLEAKPRPAGMPIGPVRPIRLAEVAVRVRSGYLCALLLPTLAGRFMLQASPSQGQLGEAPLARVSIRYCNAKTALPPEFRQGEVSQVPSLCTEYSRHLSKVRYLPVGAVHHCAHTCTISTMYVR